MNERTPGPITELAARCLITEMNNVIAAMAEEYPTDAEISFRPMLPSSSVYPGLILIEASTGRANRMTSARRVTSFVDYAVNLMMELATFSAGFFDLDSRAAFSAWKQLSLDTDGAVDWDNVIEEPAPQSWERYERF